MWHRACTHTALKWGEGSERSLDKVPTEGTLIDTTCAGGRHKVSMDPAHRATEHMHTHIWGRIQCSLGPESEVKQILTGVENQCL